MGVDFEKRGLIRKVGVDFKEMGVDKKLKKTYTKSNKTDFRKINQTGGAMTSGRMPDYEHLLTYCKALICTSGLTPQVLAVLNCEKPHTGHSSHEYALRINQTIILGIHGN